MCTSIPTGQTDTQTDRPTETQTDRHSHRQTHRHTDRRTDIQTYRQTDINTYKTRLKQETREQYQAKAWLDNSYKTESTHLSSSLPLRTQTHIDNSTEHPGSFPGNRMCCLFSRNIALKERIQPNY